jgi:hypothetical protein
VKTAALGASAPASTGWTTESAAASAAVSEARCRARGGDSRRLRVRLHLRRGLEVPGDLLGEDDWIAALRRKVRGFLLFLLEPEQPPPATAIVLVERGEQRDRERLHVLGAFERPQVRDELFFLPRREERRDEDQVRRLLLNRGERAVLRIDDRQLRAGHAVLDHVRERRRLAGIRFDGEDVRHGDIRTRRRKAHAASARQQNAHNIRIFNCLELGLENALGGAGPIPRR